MSIVAKRELFLVRKVGKKFPKISSKPLQLHLFLPAFVSL